MTAAHQLSIDDALSVVSEPISGETAATVELVGNDWRAEEDWQRFEAACRAVAVIDKTTLQTFPGTNVVQCISYVDPNDVRAVLTDIDWALTIEPRRYSAFWHRAAKGKDAFLVADGWVTNTDHAGGNAGKPLRRYRLREAS